MNIDRRSIGPPIPSSPISYRAFMSGIHDLFCANCKPSWPMLYRAVIPTPTPKVASAVIKAVSFVANSFFLGKKYFLDILYTDIIVGGVKKQLANATLWTNDKIINGTVNGVGKLVAKIGTFTYENFDQKGIDRVVNGLGSTSQGTGSVLTKVQSGKLQRYAILLFSGVIALALVVIFINR